MIIKSMILTASAIGAGTVTVLGQTQPDVLNGGAGWASFGIAGLVLAWLLLVRLPAQDRQTKDLADQMVKERDKMESRYDVEREAERKARHERQNAFQEMLMRISANHAQTSKEIQDQHIRDAAADRESFTQRQNRIEEAIASGFRTQTQALELALVKAVQGMCRFIDCANYKPRENENNANEGKGH